jgi:hypothetical protein
MKDKIKLIIEYFRMFDFPRDQSQRLAKGRKSLFKKESVHFMHPITLSI